MLVIFLKVVVSVLVVVGVCWCLFLGVVVWVLMLVIFFKVVVVLLLVSVCCF